MKMSFRTSVNKDKISFENGVLEICSADRGGAAFTLPGISGEEFREFSVIFSDTSERYKCPSEWHYGGFKCGPDKCYALSYNWDPEIDSDAYFCVSYVAPSGFRAYFSVAMEVMSGGPDRKEFYSLFKYAAEHVPYANECSED